MEEHICNKEGEIATMIEKINNIETKVDRMENKMDKFIDTADLKYVSKEEFNLFKESLKETKKEHKDWIMWIPTLIIAGIELYKFLTTGSL